MNKLIQNFIKFEKSIQIMAVIGATVFIGFVFFTNLQNNKQESTPVISPTTQQ